MAHVFNSDILIHEDDRREARREFPDVAFALENDALADVFKPIDRRANLSKARSRRWGVYSVLLATAALMLAAGEMLYDDLPKNQIRILAAVGVIAAIASVIIGVFGIMFHERKMRWLADRLTTERLRQFHFQAYAAGAAEILAGAKDEKAQAQYLAARAVKFEEFAKGLLADIDDRLVHLAHEEDVGDGMAFEETQAQIDPNDPHLNQYFAAYEKLRFDRQVGYFDHVLREDKNFWKHGPARQAQLIGAVAVACVFAVLGLYALIFMGAITNVEWMKGPMIHVFAIWAAIIVLTARIFEEGFQPNREIERMRRHRFAVKQIQTRYLAAKTPAAKIAAMHDHERLSYHEMVHFLKSNYEAQFIM